MASGARCPLSPDVGRVTAARRHFCRCWAMSTTVDTSHQGMILTIDEAAAYLAIPKATLYTWRTRRVGFGPRAVKMGGCLRYRRADLDAWIVEHLEPAEGE